MRQWKRSFTLTISVVVLLIVTAITLVLSPSKAAETHLESNYAISNRAPFNQPSYYSLKQPISQELYQPTGTWVGRLILPTPEEISEHPAIDWVWMEVYQALASAQHLIGEKVLVTWQNNPSLAAYVKLVTTDIKFTSQANQSVLEGNILPTRLNGRSQVGPLQSLAGARPQDDLIVRLDQVKVIQNKHDQTTLQIADHPIQITGRFYGLVKIIRAATSSLEIPPSCPGKQPCSSQLFQVIHYNKKSGQFDGEPETIRIPQQPIGGNGRYNSTPNQIETSPANQAGWYIYGDKDQQGIFTVQAITPRVALQLEPNRLILGLEAGLNYIDVENWQNTEAQKGKLQTVSINPKDQQSSTWSEGDSALVIHLFGGIGGKKGELGFLKFPTGHFSFGVAKVVREPLTGELQFDIQYQQVYAHNSDAIISGRTSWASYLGNLERGWLATRPISDVIVKLDLLKDYLYNQNSISPLKELLEQTEIVMARYRTGDGTGLSSVTPATSCVQDSIQALYVAMQIIKQQLESQSEYNTNDPLSKQFISFANDLEAELVPFGIVRPDWQKNVNRISGINHPGDFLRIESLWAGLLSWQSMIPRRAVDQMSRLFFSHGSSLSFIRTNQVGGWQPDIYPVAPTPINGLPFISTSLTRLILAFKTPTTAFTWWVMMQWLLLYALIALPIGFSSGFLRWSPSNKHLRAQILGIFAAIFFPGLGEEIFFRVLLIPHPLERVAQMSWLFWAFFSLVIFVLSHPVNAVTIYRRAKPTFFEPIFLVLTALLGITCTMTYAFTGSIWPSVIIHWLAVVIWLFTLGGRQKLNM